MVRHIERRVAGAEREADKTKAVPFRQSELRRIELVAIPDQARQRLDEVSKPKLHFGPELMAGLSGYFGGGTTINGQYCDLYPGVPTDAERF